MTHGSGLDEITDYPNNVCNMNEQKELKGKKEIHRNSLSLNEEEKGRLAYFLSLLLEIDRRINPHFYSPSEEPNDTSCDLKEDSKYDNI